MINLSTSRALRPLLACIAFMAVEASAGTASANISMTGTVTGATCSVNNDRVSEIAFGDIAVEEIDGTHFWENIPVSVSCTGLAPGSNVSLTFSGTAETWDSGALATSVPGLGLKLYRDRTTALTLGQKYSHPLSSLPVFSVVPVIKNLNAALVPGDFSATATLTVEPY